MWEFLRERTLESSFGRLPFAVFLRVLHGWSGSFGLRPPPEHEAVEALEAAGYVLVEGDRGDWLVKGLRLVPRGEIVPDLP